jgi:hypothetical protein
MNGITDVASSPIVAIPTALGISAANLFAALPLLINIGTFAYIVVLLAHKLWVWHEEYKTKKLAKDEGDELP